MIKYINLEKNYSELIKLQPESNVLNCYKEHLRNDVLKDEIKFEEIIEKQVTKVEQLLINENLLFSNLSNNNEEFRTLYLILIYEHFLSNQNVKFATAY